MSTKILYGVFINIDGNVANVMPKHRIKFPPLKRGFMVAENPAG
jgi:hypothetical protein